MEAAKYLPLDPCDEELDELFEQNGDDLPISPVNVDDEIDAERHLESLARLDRDLAKLQAHRSAMVQRAEDWYEKQSRTLKRRTLWHSESLRCYLQLLGRKSIKLVNGTLKIVKGRESLKLVDVDGNETKDGSIFIAWAKKNNRSDLIRTKIIEEADKKAIKESGIMAPGVKLVMGEDSFSIKLSGETEVSNDSDDS